MKHSLLILFVILSSCSFEPGAAPPANIKDVGHHDVKNNTHRDQDADLSNNPSIEKDLSLDVQPDSSPQQDAGFDTEEDIEEDLTHDMENDVSEDTLNDSAPDIPADNCNGLLTDLSRDALHCGSCDNKCGHATGCKDSQCVPLPGYLFCNGKSVDPREDPKHCGSCNHKCDEKEICKTGVCEKCTIGSCFNECTNPRRARCEKGDLNFCAERNSNYNCNSRYSIRHGNDCGSECHSGELCLEAGGDDYKCKAVRPAPCADCDTCSACTSSEKCEINADNQVVCVEK